jgi:hypothetical protein
MYRYISQGRAVSYCTRAAAVRHAKRDGAHVVRSPSGVVVWTSDGSHTPGARLVTDWAIASGIVVAWALLIICSA